MNLKVPQAALAQLKKWSLGDPGPLMGNFEVSCLWRIVVVFRAAFEVVVGSGRPPGHNTPPPGQGKEYRKKTVGLSQIRNGTSALII